MSKDEVKWCPEVPGKQGCTIHVAMRKLKDATIIFESEYRTGRLIIIGCVFFGIGWVLFVWLNGSSLHLEDAVSKAIGTLLGAAVTAIPARLYKDAFWSRDMKHARVQNWMAEASVYCSKDNYDPDLAAQGLELAKDLVDKSGDKAPRKEQSKENGA